MTQLINHSCLSAGRYTLSSSGATPKTNRLAGASSAVIRFADKTSPIKKKKREREEEKRRRKKYEGGGAGGGTGERWIFYNHSRTNVHLKFNERIPDEPTSRRSRVHVP